MVDDTNGPDRRKPGYIPDHHHPGLWTRREHERYDDKLGRTLKELRDEVHALSTRVMLFVGGLAVLTFVIYIVAPTIQAMLVPSP